MHELIATCSRGAEAALAQEIRTILAQDASVDQRRGAVSFPGDLEAAYRVLLWSRLASRLLLVLHRFDCPHADALYQGVRSVSWREHMDSRMSLAVDFVGLTAGIRNSHFGALRTKDAVVDQLRRGGERPRVDTRSPDLRIHVRLHRGVATVSVDLSGETLHRRGYRLDTGPAPLKETLAATVLWMAGWPALAAEGVPLVDPMCGSGTLLVEGASMALDRAPGLSRKRWGHSRWLGRDQGLWSHLREEARERGRAAAHLEVRVYGSDLDPQVLEAAQRNARRAEVPLRLAHRSLTEVRPPTQRQSSPRGLLITNPPYGERLGELERVEATYRELGDVLRRHWLGWRAHVLAGSPALAKHFGLRPTAKIPLFNGPLECRLVQLDISTKPVEGRGPGWR